MRVLSLGVFLDYFFIFFKFSVWRMHVKPFLSCLNESSGKAVALSMAMAASAFRPTKCFDFSPSGKWVV